MCHTCAKCYDMAGTCVEKSNFIKMNLSAGVNTKIATLVQFA